MIDYQDLINDEIKKWYQTISSQVNKQSPFEVGLFGYEETVEERPPWALSFAEKRAGIQPERKHFFNIPRGPLFKSLNPQLDLDGIKVEREVFLDERGETIMIERIYAMYDGSQKLRLLTTVMPEVEMIFDKRVFRGKHHFRCQPTKNSVIIGWRMSCSNIAALLYMSHPLVLLQ